MFRIWFNHWFRTAYSLIELVKQGVDGAYIIGSHSFENSPIRLVCDEWYKEDKLSESEYVDFCVNFCREHKVDIFVPHRFMTALAKNKARFDEIGVRLLSDSFETLSLFENKALAYNELKNSGVNVPEFRTVTTADGFKEAYRELSSEYEELCVKFVKDEGAQSFRRIKPKTDAFDSLRVYPGFSITFEELHSSLESRESFDELMIMPYLSGIEVSADCLKTDGGNLILPRFKGAAHIEELRFDEEILNMTSVILEKFDLNYPCDVQFRYLDGKPYLLEVNARMSGGLPMNCMAANVNIPALAIKKLLGAPCPMPNYERTERVFSNVELPVIIA